MPELEKRKAELEKKRMMHSVTTQQLIDHAKWYSTIREDNLKKFKKELDNKSIDRKIKSSDSTFTF